jgi:hypothetical protein
MFVLAADALETATWGLVLATAFLVVATAIPAYQRWQDARTRRLARSARLVPDMHMMRGRLNRRMERLRSAHAPDYELLDDSADDANELLRILGGISDQAAEGGLAFTNEIYVLRHLLSQAKYASEAGAAALAEGHDGVPQFEKAYREFAAAKLTVDAAEALLPKGTTTIDGERFWDRFTRLSAEREATAEKDKRRDLGR